ncbi:MAG: D-glycerate dehydrogenase [Thermus sp.]|uniref:2-hydroxyacid dehydrogenase n=1 Tax=Thermus sp. TaxID=275 RepID=UPI0025F764DA|nr:D-glycerate dehydrogenase [Thermus sp.]MCS6869401.1 D-glycerate dehydrogenase [Thermus sp.]MCS7218301.1 D-glycerate dehydrogenase [Thermus sp.]MCX7849101.1 D-glycerate dehydrogenase [Thermus sp.]MDW8016285.1 D-glycerate dehydrogenase [Thermus sp.]MDW8356703.1 D-glycerate dehydrogenase [Thermus sp.]
MRVLVTRTLPGNALDRLRERGLEVEVHQGLFLPREELLRKVQGVVGLIPTVEDRVDAEVMDRAGPGLRVIACYSVGVDHVDLEAAKARGIRVTHTPGVLTEATADLTLALLLAVARRLVEGVEHAREGRWQAWHPELLLGLDLGGLTLGIVGMGRIGQAVAQRAQAFGMRVVYHSRTPKPLPYPHLALEALLAQADVVSLHAPLTPETHRLMNRERLFAMKPGGILLNTARGGLVDTEALVEALEGHLFGAGLDVTDPEPLPPGHPLYALKNAVITPHLGSAGRRTRERMAAMAVDNLLAVLEGQEPPNPVV